MRKSCADCKTDFEAKRASAKYCSERCKKRAQRRPGGTAAPVVDLKPARIPEAPPSGSVAAATRAALDKAGRTDTPAGQAALTLATRIDWAQMETGAGLAALVRQHLATLAEAVRGAEKAADPLDELRMRRERKLGTG